MKFSFNGFRFFLHLLSPFSPIYDLFLSHSFSRERKSRENLFVQSVKILVCDQSKLSRCHRKNVESARRRLHLSAQTAKLHHTAHVNVRRRTGRLTNRIVSRSRWETNIISKIGQFSIFLSNYTSSYSDSTQTGSACLISYCILENYINQLNMFSLFQHCANFPP